MMCRLDTDGNVGLGARATRPNHLCAAGHEGGSEARRAGGGPAGHGSSSGSPEAGGVGGEAAGASRNAGGAGGMCFRCTRYALLGAGTQSHTQSYATQVAFPTCVCLPVANTLLLIVYAK
jgi:hypothetical protein